MYEALGYSVYRRVLSYYSGAAPEDAFDMRKPMPRDPEGQSLLARKREIRPDELDWD